MFCSKCGNEIQDGQKFCKSCGTQIASASATKAEVMQEQVKPVKKPQASKEVTKAKPPKSIKNVKKTVLLVLFAIILALLIGLLIAVLFKNIGINNQYKEALSQITQCDVKSDSLTEELTAIQDRWRSTSIISFNQKYDVIYEMEQLYGKYDTAVQELTDYQLQLESHENSKKEYDLNGKVASYKDYLKALEACKKNVEERNYDAAKTDIDKLNKAKEKVIKDNNKYIDKKLKKFEDSEFYYDGRLSSVVDNINSLQNEEQYDQISAKLTEASNTLSDLKKEKKAEEQAEKRRLEQEARDELKDLINGYLNDFTLAMDENNYYYISEYILSGSPFENEQSRYVTDGYNVHGIITDEFLRVDFKTIEFTSLTTAIITTEEQYRVDWREKGIEIVRNRAIYHAVRQNGRWYLETLESHKL